MTKAYAIIHKANWPIKSSEARLTVYPTKYAAEEAIIKLVSDSRNDPLFRVTTADMLILEVKGPKK